MLDDKSRLQTTVYDVVLGAMAALCLVSLAIESIVAVNAIRDVHQIVSCIAAPTVIRNDVLETCP